MQKYILFEIVLIYIVIFFDLVQGNGIPDHGTGISVQGDEIPVIQSKLEVVMYDDKYFEFHLKDRGNLSVDIRPTSTLPLESDSQNDKKSRRQIMENASVPLIASLYIYDSAAVEILRRFLEEKSKNISSVLKKLIYRYINEWDEIIRDPTTEDLYSFHGHPFQELETPFLSLPKEIGNMFKLIRMNVRVQTELPSIIKLLENSSYNETVEELVQTEIQSENYFDFESLKLTAFEALKLSEMYFRLPAGLLPQPILQNIPLKDLITVSMAAYEEYSLKEPLKWLHLGLQRFSHTYLIDASATESSEKSADSVKSVTEYVRNYTTDSESTISPITESLRKNSIELSNSVTDNVTENIAGKVTENIAENSSENENNFTRTYIDILINHFSFKHDYSLNISDYGSTFDNLFLKLLSQASVEEQSGINSLRTASDIASSLKPTYKELCNGLDFRNPKELSKLSCRYDHLGVPWYFLMPVKVEVLTQEPEIAFYHQVLSDSKIELLLQLAMPMQTESGVRDTKRKKNEKNSLARSSYVAPLKDAVHPGLEEISLISQYLSGLETKRKEDAEPIQVNSYKPGGHYVAHMDSFGALYPENDPEGRNQAYSEPLPNGDRIATILYYLNDVKEGGRTAFTNLGISITPERGGAVLWFSLFPSGEEDKRMQHAGCPVLKGIKTVANKWMRYNSQLFRRPCLLKKSIINNKYK